MASPSRRIPGLDGLRGLAALVVVLSHMAHAGLTPLPGLNLGGAGKSGVWLFFVLSAFLLLSQMLAWAPERRAVLGRLHHRADLPHLAPLPPRLPRLLRDNGAHW